ncbi:MAG: 3-hydroxyacyl-ACP dehydratase [Hyphomonadaceae bacterium]|nr:3-hydroxyacyl-ACP dehydratase [Hyphomonadaceae bacterium]
MLLIDEIMSQDDTLIRTRTTLTEANPFFQPGRGIPSYITFEIMAQSISAYDGAVRRASGESPAIGFLIGCRKFKTSCNWLQPGTILETEAISLLADGEMRSFDCTMKTSSGSDVAMGIINVFRPDDPDAFLAQVSTRNAS